MKKQLQNLILTVALGMVFTVPHGQCTEAGDTNRDADRSTNHPFLWETDIAGCKIYIAATVHVGRKDHPAIPEAFLEPLMASDGIILEIAEDFRSLRGLMLDYLRKDSLPEEKYFRHVLGPATKEKIVKVMGEEDFLLFDRYNAWILVTQLSVNKMKVMGYEPSLAVDRMIRERAAKEGKDIVGLESPTDQFSLFEFDLPYEVQVKLLEKTADNMQEAAEKEALLYEFYFKGDVPGFERTFLERFDLDNPAQKAAYTRIFSERNEKWAGQLEEMAGQCSGTFFLAIGAGHLFGPDNLLECLQEKGYTITSGH